MNTYTISWYPPGQSAAPWPSVSVMAKEFIFGDQYVLFMDDSSPAKAILSVPHHVLPVIQRVATAAAVVA